jgi:hypothetical protein
LIQPTLKNPEELLATLEAKDTQVDLFLKDTHESILKILKQAKYLSSIYHVVTANPPYMGAKGMNARLTKWAKDNYPDSRSDLFAMFIERNLILTIKFGYSSMINMQSWMFLSSFEKLRLKMLNQSTISSMAHLGSRAFNTIGGEVVSTTAYVVLNNALPSFQGNYLRLVQGKSEYEKEKGIIQAIKHLDCDWFHHASTEDFNSIPGSPIAYWVSDKIRSAFLNGLPLKEVADPKKGLATTDNNRFLRFWHEVSNNNLGLDYKDKNSAKASNKKWFPLNKGGTYRKWYGNLEYVINWAVDGEELKNAVINRYGGGSYTKEIRSEDKYFKDGITWSALTSTESSFRYTDYGALFDSAGSTMIPKSDKEYILGLLNSPVIKKILSVLNPTLNFGAGTVSNIPVIFSNDTGVKERVLELIDITKSDWDAYETAWGFKASPLLGINDRHTAINVIYDLYYSKSKSIISHVQDLEQTINDLALKAYGLQEELSSLVPTNKITLNCNPKNRYGGDKTDDEFDELILADTMRDMISYAVGCMFGRYSIDRDGLILVDQNDNFESYLKKVPSPSFFPDADNVIPIIDFEGDWFEDDITERFKEFLKVTFGEEHFAENLTFIEEAIGKDIKKFFLKDFYTDHVKRYKKRPIYWMFSSPKGSFNALIYMHRYQPDTASIVLNDYLREFRTKLEARKQNYEQVEISVSASQKDKTQAIKTVAKINTVLEEINDYEHDVLYPLAGEKIEIDLDDGVKHNYPLFGNALKKITGLS